MSYPDIPAMGLNIMVGLDKFVLFGTMKSVQTIHQWDHVISSEWTRF